MYKKYLKQEEEIRKTQQGIKKRKTYIEKAMKKLQAPRAQDMARVYDEINAAEDYMYLLENENSYLLIKYQKIK